MAEDFDGAFAALKKTLGKHSAKLAVKTDTAERYTLVGRKPSPVPKHKGQPMWFGEVKVGKAYVSLHLLPLYMNPPLEKKVPAGLKKRMQGQACFNFKQKPDAELLKELDELLANAIADWTAKSWL